MSSKRHVRKRACEGKQRHATQAGAIAQATSLSKVQYVRVYPYKCPFCGYYHVGRDGSRQYV